MLFVKASPLVCACAVSWTPPPPPICTSQVKRLTILIPKLETELSKCAMQSESADKRIDELSARLADMSGKSTSPAAADVERLEQLKRSLATDEKELARITKVVDAIGAEITTLQTRVLEAGGNRLKAAKTKAEKADSDVNDAVRARVVGLVVVP